MTREEAIKILSIRDGHGIPSGYNGGYAEAIDLAIEALKAKPIKHGRWIVLHGVLAGDDIYGDMGECSNCGLHLRNYEWDYCPNCGADMRGGDAE